VVDKCLGHLFISILSRSDLLRRGYQLDPGHFSGAPGKKWKEHSAKEKVVLTDGNVVFDTSEVDGRHVHNACVYYVDIIEFTTGTLI